MWCGELELSDADGVRGLFPRSGESASRVLVRLHGEPFGYLTSADGPDAAELRCRAVQVFGDRVRRHLAQDGTPWSPGGPLPQATHCAHGPADRQPISVVVCTRDRPELLRRCLASVRALRYPRFEVVVVDNAPSDDRTRALVEQVATEDGRVRYAREPRPGLSRARNRGLAEAGSPWLAYTDDDVVVDQGWLDGLALGFGRAPDVGCVTGLVATASIANPAEAYFDARASGWSSRCEPAVFRPDGRAANGPLYPFAPGQFGTGANLAFSRTALDRLGGFDEALGAGSPTRGGEDLDAFVRLVRLGESIAYEPSALVWHQHRADRDSLLAQMYGYGTGLSAFLTKCLAAPDTRSDLVRRIVPGLRHAIYLKRSTSKQLQGGTERPAGAYSRELAGLLMGPALYLRARRAAERERAVR